MLASLVVHPVRFVVTPSRNQKGKSRARAIDRYTFWNYLVFLRTTRLVPALVAHIYQRHGWGQALAPTKKAKSVYNVFRRY